MGLQGVTGPEGVTGPTGPVGPIGLLQTAFAMVEGTNNYPAGDQQVLAIPAFITQVGSITNVLATFAGSSTLTVQTPDISDFFIVIDSVLRHGAEITFVKAPGSATFSTGASGAVSWHGVLPAGSHNIELRLISDGDVSISPAIRPHSDHATLSISEVTA
jgi:hypothetical protein